MQYEEKLNLKIVDTVFDPQIYGTDYIPGNLNDKKPEPEVRFTSSGDSSLYKVWIFLAGDDLPRVETVTYKLHETFVDPIRVVPRILTNLDCRITIWTWGIFDITATILDKGGRSYGLVYRLSYGDILDKYSSSIKYLKENPEISDGAVLIA